MDREYKGHGYGAHADDYCVVDLETTGIFVRSAKIIEISAIKVRGNQVTDEYSTLVNPECPIPPDATAVNHITDDMVKDSPTIDKIIDSFMSFCSGRVISTTQSRFIPAISGRKEKANSKTDENSQ